MLGQRILSALILLPIALAAVWYGSWGFACLVGLAGVLAAWEWTRLCFGQCGRGGWVLGGMAVLVALLASFASALVLPVVFLAAFLAPLAQQEEGRSPVWMVSGAFYIGLPVAALTWVRGLDQGHTTLWLLLVVWATDIFAYAAGRLIGGPKLMPRVSPKKTWAGLLGGVSAAALIGWLMAPETGLNASILALISAGLAVLAQGGDLLESWVKRHFGVKDSSGIIPGHGGVLDRLDGLLAVAPVVAVFCMFYQGGLAEWR